MWVGTCVCEIITILITMEGVIVRSGARIVLKFEAVVVSVKELCETLTATYKRYYSH